MASLRVPTADGAGAVTVSFESVKLTGEQFDQLCRDNPETRLELTSGGELVAEPPTGSETGARNMRLSHRLQSWTEKDSSGVAFDSSTGFALPNGARRSPDASWLRRERWGSLSEREREGFAPLCPDFVVELRSPSDDVDMLKQKMVEYLENGAQLGWLIDPSQRRVHVYRPDMPMETLESPESLRGDPTLPGFVLSLRDLW